MRRPHEILALLGELGADLSPFAQEHLFWRAGNGMHHAKERCSKLQASRRRGLQVRSEHRKASELDNICYDCWHDYVVTAPGVQPAWAQGSRLIAIAQDVHRLEAAVRGPKGAAEARLQLPGLRGLLEERLSEESTYVYDALQRVQTQLDALSELIAGKIDEQAEAVIRVCAVEATATDHTYDRDPRWDAPEGVSAVLGSINDSGHMVPFVDELWRTWYVRAVDRNDIVDARTATIARVQQIANPVTARQLRFTVDTPPQTGDDLFGWITEAWQRERDRCTEQLVGRWERLFSEAIADRNEHIVAVRRTNYADGLHAAVLGTFTVWNDERRNIAILRCPGIVARWLIRQNAETTWGLQADVADTDAASVDVAVIEVAAALWDPEGADATYRRFADAIIAAGRI